ncbi:MAG TPA: hypothetical protein VL593_11970 [Ramlibacter sp.]|jgi:hypothetical protein|nr:hypothetical protein [Ramlibacter sp.]
MNIDGDSLCRSALEQIGPRVGSLAAHGQAISDALDEVLTRSWG